MDTKVLMLARAGLLVVAFLLQASAQDRYLVRAPSAEIGNVAARHNLTYIRSLAGSAKNLHVVAAPVGADVQRTIQGLHADASVQGVEPDASVSLPETFPGAAASPDESPRPSTHFRPDTGQILRSIRLERLRQPSLRSPSSRWLRHTISPPARARSLRSSTPGWIPAIW